MKSLVKTFILFLALVVILGCEKKGTFEKMGTEMDKSAANMNKALQDVGSK